jgi:hypothetical protein
MIAIVGVVTAATTAGHGTGIDPKKRSEPFDSPLGPSDPEKSLASGGYWTVYFWPELGTLAR